MGRAAGQGKFGLAAGLAGRGGLELLLGPLRVLAVLVRSLLGPLGILITLVVIFRKELGAFWEGIKEGFGKVAERISEAWNNVVNAWNMAFGKSSTDQLKGWKDAGVSFGEALGQLTVVALGVVASLSVMVRAVQQLAVWALKLSGQGGSALARELEGSVRAAEQGAAVTAREIAKGTPRGEAQRRGFLAQETTLRADLPRQQEMAAKIQAQQRRGPTFFGIPLTPSTTGGDLPSYAKRMLSQPENFEQKRDTLLRDIEAIGGKDARESLQIRMEQYTPKGQLRMLGEWLKFYKEEPPSRPSTPPPTPVPEKTSMRSRPMNPTALAITGGNTQSEYAAALA
jgi:hypothetical protein